MEHREAVQHWYDYNFDALSSLGMAACKGTGMYVLTDAGRELLAALRDREQLCDEVKTLRAQVEFLKIEVKLWDKKHNEVAVPLGLKCIKLERDRERLDALEEEVDRELDGFPVLGWDDANGKTLRDQADWLLAAKPGAEPGGQEE